MTKLPPPQGPLEEYQRPSILHHLADLEGRSATDLRPPSLTRAANLWIWHITGTFHALPDVRTAWDSAAPSDAGEVAQAKTGRLSGFVQVNYDSGDGGLLITGCVQFWNNVAKDALFRLVQTNADLLRYIIVHVFDPAHGSVEKDGYSSIHGMTSREKLLHIPFISDSPRGKALLIVHGI